MLLPAQYNSEKPKDAKQAYFREEELLYKGKRYRVHNNYISGGIGYLLTSIRNEALVNSCFDLVFHIRRQHFAVGGYVAGKQLGANSHYQGHLCYGYRKESTRFNLAIFAGPGYNKGVIAVPDSAQGTRPEIYDRLSFYTFAQAVFKLKYDIGIGAETFAELDTKQSTVGFRVILFFSGSYRGLKKNVNPNVRSQRKR